MKKRTIPFIINHLNHGFSQAKGLLHLKKEEILFEFEREDTVTGLLKSGVKEVAVPFSELESITFKKRWLGAAIEIETRSMKTMAEIPGAEQGRCTLKIKRKDRAQAEKTISSARLQLSEFRLKELDE